MGDPSLLCVLKKRSRERYPSKLIGGLTHSRNRNDSSILVDWCADRHPRPENLKRRISTGVTQPEKLKESPPIPRSKPRLPYGSPPERRGNPVSDIRCGTTDDRRRRDDFEGYDPPQTGDIRSSDAASLQESLRRIVVPQTVFSQSTDETANSGNTQRMPDSNKWHPRASPRQPPILPPEAKP